MKKLLLLLLCVPLIGLGQIKVINSNKTDLIGVFEIEDNAPDRENSLSCCADGIKLEKKNNIISLSYDNCDLHHVCDLVIRQLYHKDNLFSVNVEINDNGTVIVDLYNLIQSEFNSLGTKKVDKCIFGSGVNIVKTIELETIGDNLILNWIGYKEDGQMFFSYKGQQSHALNMEEIKQLFDN